MSLFQSALLRCRTPRANSVPRGSRYRYTKRRYRAAFRLLDSVGGLLTNFARCFRPAPPREEPRSILIVQLDHVGDAVLTTPVLAALRSRFPDAVIDVLAAPWNAPVFSGNPAVRHVHLSEHNWQARRPAQRAFLAEVVRQGRRLRRFQYDLAIDPRGDFFVVLTLWLAGIPRRLGWACGGGGFLLTDVASWDAARHEFESRRVLLEAIDVAPTGFQPELFPTWADRSAVREMLAEIAGRRSPFVVVHASAGTPAKQWPLEHFSQLVGRLTRELGATVALVGATDDRSRGRWIAHTCPLVVDWTGRLSLLQLASLLDETDVFIGGDSGPAHVAAAMGTPSIVLFSGTNRAECWRPVGDEVVVLREAVPCSPCHLNACPIAGHPCMSGVRPADVMEAVRGVLARGRGDRTRRSCSAVA